MKPMLGRWKLAAPPGRPISRGNCVIHNGTLWATVQNTNAMWRGDEVTLSDKLLKYDIASDEWFLVDTDFTVSGVGLGTRQVRKTAPGVVCFWFCGACSSLFWELCSLARQTPACCAPFQCSGVQFSAPFRGPQIARRECLAHSSCFSSSCSCSCTCSYGAAVVCRPMHQPRGGCFGWLYARRHAAHPWQLHCRGGCSTGQLCASLW